MAVIQSLGIGSGLDINNLVEQLVSAERVPTESRLDRKQQTLEAELSTMGTIKSALSTFQSAVSSLNSPTLFRAHTASSSDDTVLRASASSVASNGTYQVEVKNLAQSHSLATTSFSSASEVIGTGTLTFRFGTTDYNTGTDTYNSFTADSDQATFSIEINSSNNTLSGLRDAINNADGGVQASIVNDGSGYRLLLTSASTGASNSLEVTVDEGTGLPADNTDTSGLSRLAFNASATHLEQTVIAQDSEIVVNGLTVNRSENLVAGVISGVTLDLNKAAPGAPVTVKVEQDLDAITSKMESFVTAYNDLRGLVNDATAFNAETGEAGILLGDSATRALMNQLRQAMGQSIGALQGGAFSTLSEVGISTNSKTGLLSFDSSVFQTAVKNRKEDVVSLFATNGIIADSQIEYYNASVNTKAGEYAVNITQLATQGVFQGASVLPADFAATPMLIDASNDTFTISVDGTLSNSISLTHDSYSDGDTLAQEIQSQINADENLKKQGKSVSVAYDPANNRFEVTSSAFGSSSTIEFSQVEAGDFGLSVGSGTAGVDVAGTINGVAATGSGQFLTGAKGDAAEGLRIKILGGATGARGNISYVQGVAHQLDSLIDTMLSTDGLFDSKTNSIQKRLSDISGQRATLELKLDSFEARLLAQFTAMDSIVASLQNTGNYLEQQLAVLPFANLGKD